MGLVTAGRGGASAGGAAGGRTVVDYTARLVGFSHGDKARRMIRDAAGQSASQSADLVTVRTSAAGRAAAVYGMLQPVDC